MKVKPNNNRLFRVVCFKGGWIVNHSCCYAECSLSLHKPVAHGSSVALNPNPAALSCSADLCEMRGILPAVISARAASYALVQDRHIRRRLLIYQPDKIRVAASRRIGLHMERVHYVIPDSVDNILQRPRGCAGWCCGTLECRHYNEVSFVCELDE